uniref:Ovule protein n=1 Tax=Ascaris lumbricoides TaxID=6252 RepID=A0A0M3HMY8_ASCLU
MHSETPYKFRDLCGIRQRQCNSLIRGRTCLVGGTFFEMKKHRLIPIERHDYHSTQHCYDHTLCFYALSLCSIRISLR